MIPYRVVISPFLLTNEDYVFNELTNTKHIVNAVQKKILSYLSVSQKFTDVIDRYDKKIVLTLLNDGILVDSNEKWNLTNIHTLEIETSTHCNWQCRFCPVHIEPKQRSIMSLQFFKKIIEKAVKHETIRFVTFNSYNETTINPILDKYILVLADSNMKLQLHTNGTGLTFNKLRLLAQCDVLDSLFFNIPTLNELDFYNLTRAPVKSYKLLREKVESAMKLGLPIKFSVQGNAYTVKDTTDQIRYWLGSAFDQDMISNWHTTDRAGLLRNEYSHNVNIRGKLMGCTDVLQRLYVGVKGDCFQCCEDYYQETVYGNIMDGEISQILLSDGAKNMRQYVYGDKLANDTYLCRRCILMAYRVKTRKKELKYYEEPKSLLVDYRIK